MKQLTVLLKVGWGPEKILDRLRAIWLDGPQMKTKLLTAVCLLAIGSIGVAPCHASETHSAGEVAADVIIARPACLAATVIGAALFIVSLPIAAISKSVDTSREVLVVKPAKATFTRPLGDLDALRH